MTPHSLKILFTNTHQPNQKSIKDVCNFHALAFYWFIEPTLLSIEALITVNNIACTCLEAIYIVIASLFYLKIEIIYEYDEKMKIFESLPSKYI